MIMPILIEIIHKEAPIYKENALIVISDSIIFLKICTMYNISISYKVFLLKAPHICINDDIKQFSINYI